MRPLTPLQVLRAATASAWAMPSPRQAVMTPSVFLTLKPPGMATLTRLMQPLDTTWYSTWSGNRRMFLAVTSAKSLVVEKVRFFFVFACSIMSLVAGSS